MAQNTDKTKKKPNWIKIRTEYETTQISHRKLCEKYNIKYPTLKDRARREEWVKSKEEKQRKIYEKTLQKLIEKKSDKNAYDISIELEATNLINKLVLETLQDANQFKKHLVTKKRSETTAGLGGTSSQWVEEKEFGVVDAKRLQALTASLETASKLKRLLQEIIDPATREKLDIDKKKVEQEEKQDNEIKVVLEGSLDDWGG